MKRIIFILSLVLLLSYVVTQASATDPEIKPYPGAKHLCGKHVAGAPRDGKPGAHITWNAYYSRAGVNKVVDFYKDQLGTEKYSFEQDSHGWVFSDTDAHSVTHSLILDIKKFDAEGPWTSCRSKIPNHGTIIMISSMVKSKS